MSQSEQQQRSSFTYFPNSSNSIPNSLLSFPQSASLPSQPLLFPPGTDPYAHQGQLTFTHVGFDPQAQFYQDPNAGSQSWITTQADPIRYGATSSVAASKQSLVNNVIGSVPNQSNLIQPLRCEVCDVVCKTKYVYEAHFTGKKHLKNLQAMINPVTTIFPETSSTINNVSIVGQTGNVGGQLISGASCVATVHELERKKQQLLNAGAPVDSVRMCTICNVACNSHDAFVKHLSGRRHAAQAGLIAVDGIGPYLAAIRANDQFWHKGKKITKNKISEPIWCQVCQINCTSTDVYAKHLSGKKHLKNLQDLEKSKNGSTCPSSSIDTPAATNMLNGAVQNPAADGHHGADVQKSEKMIVQSEAPKEDLETKKRKVLEGGAAANDVRVCTICNVVCNSQKVFNFHLTGQKHAAMVQKLANPQIPIETPQTR